MQIFCSHSCAVRALCGQVGFSHEKLLTNPRCIDLRRRRWCVSGCHGVVQIALKSPDERVGSSNGGKQVYSVVKGKVSVGISVYVWKSLKDPSHVAGTVTPPTVGSASTISSSLQNESSIPKIKSLVVHLCL